MTIAASASEQTAASSTSRWWQLIFGIICMVMIANLQYGWTLFVDPMDAKYHWGRPANPDRILAVRADRDLAGSGRRLVRGPLRPADRGRGRWHPGRNRLDHELGGVIALGTVRGRRGLGGIGAGAVYGTCVGNALKWFSDRRGLAAGLTAAGFGAGAALTVVPIRAIIDGPGYESAFLWFGLGQGLIVFVSAILDGAPARRGARSEHGPARATRQRANTLRRTCCAPRCSGCCT